MNTVKLAFYGVLIAAIFYGGYHVAAVKGKSNLEALQLAWDDNKAAIQAEADKAIAQATKEREAALEANGVIQSDYQAQLSTSQALNAGLSQRLRQYQSTSARSGPVPQASGGQQPVDPSTAQRLGLLDDAVASALTECADNRVQLNALIAQIKPQL
jgi:hypothetical protein